MKNTKLILPQNSYVVTEIPSPFSTGRHIHIKCVLNCLKCVIYYYRVRHRITKEAPISIYYTLCYLHIMYCLSIWGCTQPSYLNYVFVIQKRIVRTISFRGKYDLTANLFATLKLLNFQSVHKYFLLFTMFKSLRFSPCNELILTYVEHSHNIRGNYVNLISPQI